MLSSAKHPKQLIVGLFVVAVSILAIFIVNQNLSKPNDTTRAEMAWLKTESSALFGGLGELAPQNISYNCNIPQKLISGCYLEASPTMIGNNPNIQKYVIFGIGLPAQLAQNKWTKFKSIYPTPETKTNSKGKTSINLNYTKQKDKLHCELSYVVENGTLNSYPGNYSTWYIRCK